MAFIRMSNHGMSPNRRWASRILPERDAANALLLKKKTVVTVMESKENAAERNVGDRK